MSLSDKIKSISPILRLSTGGWGCMAALLFLVSMNPGTVYAQDLAGDIAAMKKKYAGTESCHALMEVKVYEKERGALMVTYRSELFLKGKQYLMKSDFMDIVSGNDFTAMLNHHDKTVIYTEGKKEARTETLTGIEQVSVAGLDSMLRKNCEVKYMGSKEGLKHYLLVYKDTSFAYRETEIYMDATSVKKMVYRHGGGSTAYTVQTFLKNEPGATISSDLFSPGRYVQRTGGKLRLNERWLDAGYVLNVMAQK